MKVSRFASQEQNREQEWEGAYSPILSRSDVYAFVIYIMHTYKPRTVTLENYGARDSLMYI